mgnify:CR=1 FL=1|jgi:hypothetical protein
MRIKQRELFLIFTGYISLLFIVYILLFYFKYADLKVIIYSVNKLRADISMAGFITIIPYIIALFIFSKKILKR